MLLVFLCDSNVGGAGICVALWPASSIASLATAAGASRTIHAVILVLVLRSVITDAALTTSTVVTDVATWIRKITVSLLRILLFRRQITLLLVVPTVRVLPVLLARLAPRRLLLNILTARLNRHLRDIAFARLLVLGVVTNVGHALSSVNLGARR